jgi:hypothetical protein
MEIHKTQQMGDRTFVISDEHFSHCFVGVDKGHKDQYPLISHS